MKTEKVNLVYFSPTGSTKKVLQFMGKQTGINTEEFDYTEYKNRKMKRDFTDSETVIFGVPVYGGRVPGPAALRFRNITGNGTPAVLVVTYGNREYEDALIELKDIVEERGFNVIAAAAVVTEHSIVRSIAKGRPDSGDLNEIAEFTSRFMKKLGEISSNPETGDLQVKGNRPYKKVNPHPLIPRTEPECSRCGACAEACPVNAIPADNPENTDKNLCISCMRCVMVCPDGSRKLGTTEMQMAEKVLLNLCKTEKRAEFFM